MAYYQPANPDALPRFAEPERDSPSPRPPPQQPPPVSSVFQKPGPPRHATTYDAHLSQQQQPYQPRPVPPPPRQEYQHQYQQPLPPLQQQQQQQYSSAGYRPSGSAPSASGALGPRITSPRPGGPPPHLCGPAPGTQAPPPSGPSPRLPPSPGRDSDLTQALIPLFRAVDRDGRGQLSERELGSALVNGDFTSFDPQTVRMMIRMFDSDRSGSIGFDEFCGLWSFLSQWRSLFDRFDRDRSGNISLPEFRDALFAFRYRLSDRFTEILFGQFDKRGEGHLSFDLFVQSSITLKRMTDTFKKYDEDRDGFITLAFEDFLEEVLKQMR